MRRTIDQTTFLRMRALRWTSHMRRMRQILTQRQNVAIAMAMYGWCDSHIAGLRKDDGAGGEVCGEFAAGDLHDQRLKSASQRSPSRRRGSVSKAGRWVLWHRRAI